VFPLSRKKGGSPEKIVLHGNVPQTRAGKVGKLKEFHKFFWGVSQRFSRFGGGLTPGPDNYCVK